MDRLKDKVAIVTGSTSGIGKGIARMFAAEGARVVVCGRREERGQAIVDEIASAGGQAMYHFLDVTKPETVDALLADTEAAWGGIDVMVNNAAGMALKDGRVDELTLEDWDAVFASDIRSTFYCTKTVLPFMQEQGAGSIINIGSMTSYQGGIKVIPYTASKAAVRNITMHMCNEWAAPYGIHINCIAPGYMVTDMTAPMRSETSRMAETNTRIPMDRWGVPEDLAGAAIFLASDASDYVNGFTIAVDGGFLAKS